jgi:putative membrane protein
MATRSMKNTVRAAALVGLFTPALLLAQSSTSDTGAATSSKMTAPSKTLSSGDKKFLEHAASAGMAEVELGKLAAQKGASQQVKDFGDRMARDHQNANVELEKLAGSKNLTLPSEPEKKEQRTLKDLQDKSGEKFDKAYMDLMVDEHEKDVKDFEREAKKASDPDVRAFADKTLGTLREHLQLAKDTESAVKGETKSMPKKTGGGY